jgi:hypothetical protein
MKKNARFKAFILPGLLIASGLSLAFAALAYGDGNPPGTQQRPLRPTTRQYNNRLPPVIPGEEVVTETGQKIRTWSSSGPVPVNQQPTPQTVGNGTGGSGVGVIIDGRDRFDRQPLGTQGVDRPGTGLSGR